MAQTSFPTSEGGFIILNLPLVLLHVVAIYIFWNCRKIAFCVKFWTLHLLFTFFLAVTARPLAYVLLNHEEGHFRLWYRVFDCLGRASFLSSLWTLTVTGLDRLLSLVFAMRYRAKMTNTKMYLLAVAINSCSMLASTTVFIGEIRIVHDDVVLSTTELALWISIGLVIFSGLSTIAIYVAIGYIAFKKRNAVHLMPKTGNDYSRFLKFVCKAFAIVVFFTCCYLPGIGLAVAELLSKEKYDLPYFGPILLYIFFLLHPIVQLSSFYESRYRALRMVCCCCEDYKEKLEQKFNIRYASFKIFTVDSNSNQAT